MVQKEIHTANGAGMNIKPISQSTIHTPNRDLLKNILCVPSTKKNLVSIHRLAFDNNDFDQFHHDFFYIKDQDMRSTLLRGSCQHGLHRLPSAFATKQAF